LIEADIIIAGGGSAGCVLAHRLSANPALRVLLLEAGGGAGGWLANTPGMTYRYIGNAKTDWCYVTEPDPSLGGRSSTWSGGRMLGGGSAINGLVYIRGLARDYDDWARAGCAGWSWAEVEPCFRRAERFEEDACPSLGREGLLSVSRIRSLHPLAEAFVRSCEGLGLPRLDDYNRGDADGAFFNLTTQRRGRRCSTAAAYLASASARAKLQVMTGVLVDRVLIENGRACGLAVVHEGRRLELRARHEVILSAGTLQSPAILLRSGIGPARPLQALGIAVQAEAPEVGRNLQEQPGLVVGKFVDLPTYNSEMGPLCGLRHLADYVLHRRGPLASAAVQGMAWLKSEPGLAEADIHLNWLPYGMDYTCMPPVLHQRPSISVGACVSRPHSRGEIRLRSRNPADKPIIDHRLLGDARDLQALVHSGRLIERLFAQAPLAKHVIGAAAPERLLQTDAEWESHVRQTASHSFHPVGSCRMGADAASVVDTQLRVRGVSGLRVIDASVMPRMVSANTNGPTIMIAEKGAELVAAALS